MSRNYKISMYLYLNVTEDNICKYIYSVKLQRIIYEK